MPAFSRVVFIVLDSVGLKAAPDAAKFGDEGSSTLGSLLKHRQGNLETPNLFKLGLEKLFVKHGFLQKELSKTLPNSRVATLQEVSTGKDTSSGHWEFAGIPQSKSFPIFPNGFPQTLIQAWSKENSLTGVLGNKVASGTNIIDELGEEHIRTKKPIVYTSSDSVFQVAAHEKHFGLEKLYSICESARKTLNEMNVGRVIARPFVGDKSGSFSRTENRKDYSIDPDYPNLLDLLSKNGLFVYGVGKIDDIFCHRGITQTNHTGRNETSMDAVIKALDETKDSKGLIFANFIDFDQHFGHRRDVEGYTKCLESFDKWLPTLMETLSDDDLLIISADHGNDPSFKGTDHTREIVPAFFYSKTLRETDDTYVGHHIGFQHISHLILDALQRPELKDKLSSLSTTQNILEKA